MATKTPETEYGILLEEKYPPLQTMISFHPEIFARYLESVDSIIEEFNSKDHEASGTYRRFLRRTEAKLRRIGLTGELLQKELESLAKPESYEMQRKKRLAVAVLKPIEPIYEEAMNKVKEELRHRIKEDPNSSIAKNPSILDFIKSQE